MLFDNVYKDVKVLLTGDTGFKGSWLSTWLKELGADIVGYSLYIPSNPSNFEVLNLDNKLKHIKGDIRDLDQLQRVFNNVQPDIVFHLAAQAITRLSYEIPQETFFTNLAGTVNVLECIRTSKSVKAAVMITSDKCYQNYEWVWGYRESDRLGGADPYSASKACAELACNAYFKSFFSRENFPMVATARAGNVIGGGDWAIGRIVPDCIRAFSKDEKVEIRSPNATRPWQHVLEPISGYLCLGAELLKKNSVIAGESFNFGPQQDVNKSVEELLKGFVRLWGKGRWKIKSDVNSEKKESTLLGLNCDKALHCLNWHAVLFFEQTMGMTVDWYKAFYDGEEDMYGFTVKQIEKYVELARERGLIWTKQ